MKTCPQMRKVIGALTQKHGIELSQPQAYLRLDMSGFDRLCIETIGTHRLIVAHYFEMNGDLVPDPSVTFFLIGPDKWVPIGIHQSIGGIRSYARLSLDATAIAAYDKKGQAELASFVNLWARNIDAQGWLEHATCTRSSSLDQVVPRHRRWQPDRPT